MIPAFSISILTGVVLLQTPIAQALDFTDVPDGAWYATDVRMVADAGIMEGYRDVYGKPLNVFAPADPVTRAEFLKMVAVMMVFRYDFDRTIVRTGDWEGFYARIVEAKDPQLSMIMPIDRFSLNKAILRHEAAGLLHLGLGNYNAAPPNDPPSFSDVTSDTPNFSAITELHFYKVINGDGNTGRFEPNRTLNRAEAAKILVKTAGSYQTPLGPGDKRF